MCFTCFAYQNVLTSRFFTIKILLIRVLLSLSLSSLCVSPSISLSLFFWVFHSKIYSHYVGLDPTNNLHIQMNSLIGLYYPRVSNSISVNSNIRNICVGVRPFHHKKSFPPHSSVYPTPHPHKARCLDISVCFRFRCLKCDN